LRTKLLINIFKSSVGYCNDHETAELKIAMYKSVGYYTGTQLNQTCAEFCDAAGLGDSHCTVVHPNCEGTLYPANDNNACQKEIDAIEQALDLVGDAMESKCEAMVKSPQFACILEK
jgi:hypothetical protein